MDSRGPDATSTLTPLTFADCEGPAARRFEQWVARDPERPAVRTARSSASYGALDGLANRVAHELLRSLGARPEPVALLLDKDAPLLGALMGVLKAGKIYVGLDPSHPAEHGRYVVDDCGAGLVLADAVHGAAARALAGAGRRVVVLDELDVSGDEDAPAEPITGDTLAALVYTSGSTGRPKGVLQSHRTLLHNAVNCATGVDVRPGDRFSLIQTLGGVGGLRVALTALLSGASISPYDVGDQGLGRLGAWLGAEAVTVMSLAVTGLRHFTAGLDPDDRFPSVRALKLSGEASGRSDLEALRRHFPACTLWVGLGTTETGYITQTLIPPGAPLPEGRGTLGPPAHGIEVLILDEAGAPLSPGEVGEIVVRSRYLALGYWGRPDLTGAAFEPDPEGGDRRLYRTGDLGLVRPDGSLEHHGRRDAMIKLRGHRVELGAVEFHLLAVPGIARAAVVARDRAPGDTRLVAYVAPHAMPGPAPAALRRALRAALPDFMVPSHVVVLPALPSTVQGKVDRAALPAPDWARMDREGSVVEPRTPIERELASIWADVLGLDAVGATDAFTDLGGDSLHASEIARRVLTRFHLALSVGALLRAETVEAMAMVVAEALVAGADRPIDAIVDRLRSAGPA